MKQFQRRETFQKKEKDGTTVNLLRKFTERLQLYAVPPVENVSLEEFETLGIDRLARTLHCGVGCGEGRRHECVRVCV